MSSKPDPQPGAGWEELKAAEPEERGWGPRLVIAGLALLAAAIFVAQNSERVETKFLFLSGTPRLYNIILVSLLLGALLGQAVPALRRRRKRSREKTKKDQQTK